jgi:hypothetical protein
MTIEINRHGRIESAGLPICKAGSIQGKLLVFNGREHGHPVLLGHIYSPHPFATSFVISFAISSKRRGTYGTVLTADLRKALGTKKNLTGIEMTRKLGTVLNRTCGARG